MNRHALLARWIDLERGNGLARVRSLSWKLSIAALGVAIAVGIGCTVVDYPRWLVALLAVALGWLIAERNALDARAAQWPVFREYIDWSRVDRDVDPSP